VVYWFFWLRLPRWESNPGSWDGNTAHNLIDHLDSPNSTLYFDNHLTPWHSKFPKHRLILHFKSHAFLYISIQPRTFVLSLHHRYFLNNQAFIIFSIETFDVSFINCENFEIPLIEKISAIKFIEYNWSFYSCSGQICSLTFLSSVALGLRLHLLVYSGQMVIIIQ